MLLLLVAFVIKFTPTVLLDDANTSLNHAGSTAETLTEEVATTTVEAPIEVAGEWKYPQLKRICSCESTGQPYNEPTHYLPSGEVIRGIINPMDIGMCQVNLKYHGDAAESLGLDLFDPNDNKAYAEQLYEAQGSQPWFWSEHCWG